MKNRKKMHDDWETPEYIKKSWKKVNFVNPPYNRKDKEAFIMKAFDEWKKGKTSVLLLPVSTSTKIFHDIILPNTDIRFLRGRVKFRGYNTKGQFVADKCGQQDSMIVIFNGC